jgi:hypothetical protein
VSKRESALIGCGFCSDGAADVCASSLHGLGAWGGGPSVAERIDEFPIAAVQRLSHMIE